MFSEWFGRWLSITQRPCTTHHLPFLSTTYQLRVEVCDFMSEQKSGSQCPGSIEEPGDSCEEDAELSEDGSIHDSDADFVSSDEDADLLAALDTFDEDDEDCLELEGLRVPRVVLVTWAKLTNESVVASRDTTLSSFLRSAWPVLTALQSRGAMILGSPTVSSFKELELHRLVLSPHPLLSRPAMLQTPCPTTSVATSLSTLETFTNSVVTTFNSTGSIAFERSPTPSPLEQLCSQLSLVAVLSHLAQRALKSCS